MKLYHGAGASFTSFRKDFARSPNDHFGGGLAYLTTNFQIAVGYAKASAKRTKGDPIVYTVDATFRNTFDTTAEFSGEDLKKVLPNDIDKFARGAGLIKFSTNVYDVKSKVSAGRVSISGKDVFNGLEKALGNTGRVRDHLIALKFDSLKYDGGINMMTAAHDVYIAYDNRTFKVLHSVNLNAREPSFADIANGILTTT